MSARIGDLVDARDEVRRRQNRQCEEIGRLAVLINEHNVYLASLTATLTALNASTH